jgi:predicted O-methyltransferase YrrM
MLKAIANRLAFEFLRLRLIRSSSKILRMDGITDSALADTALELSESYANYIQTISTPDMAASLELASFVYCVVKRRKMVKVLDLGSGFSSLVLRKAVAPNSGRTWSVDDHVAWLEVTREYLQRSSLSTENILLLEDFLASSERDFDLILLDLNYVEVRKNYVTMVVERCKTGGMILFDDVHKREFMTSVLEQTRNLPVTLYDLKSLTHDRFGRYALLAIKQ